MDINEILRLGYLESLFPDDLANLEQALTFGKSVQLGEPIPPDRMYVPYHPEKTPEALDKIATFRLAWTDAKLAADDFPVHIILLAEQAGDLIASANGALHEQKRIVAENVPEIHHQDLVKLVKLWKVAIRIWRANKTRAQLLEQPERPVLTLPHSGAFVSQDADPETTGAQMLGEIITRNLLYQQADPDKKTLALMAHLSSAPQARRGVGGRQYG